MSNKQARTKRYVASKLREFHSVGAIDILRRKLMERFREEEPLKGFVLEQGEQGGFIEFNCDILLESNSTLELRDFFIYLSNRVVAGRGWLISEYEKNRPGPFSVGSVPHSENETEFDPEELDKDVLASEFIVEGNLYWYDMSSKGLTLTLDERDLLEFTNSYNDFGEHEIMYRPGQFLKESPEEREIRAERTRDYIQELKATELDAETYTLADKEHILEDMLFEFDNALENWLNNVPESREAVEKRLGELDEKEFYVAVSNFLEKNFEENLYIGGCYRCGPMEMFAGYDLSYREFCISEETLKDLDIGILEDEFGIGEMLRDNSGPTERRYSADFSGSTAFLVIQEEDMEKIISEIEG